jgi:LGFP repeat/CHAP domain
MAFGDVTSAQKPRFGSRWRRRALVTVMTMVATATTSLIATAPASAVTCTYQPVGEIAVKWTQLGAGDGFLGCPLFAGERTTPDGIGRYTHFDGGSIYWTPTTGAHEVHGAIRDKWEQTGWELGLGYPTTDETATPDGVGRYNHFSNGGSIYWTPTTGAHEVHGAIREKWAEKGWELGPGYPLTDETRTPDGVGRFNHFSNGASIYWSPATGAHLVKGAIRDTWAYYGWEFGLGYPTTDELYFDGGAYTDFQRGGIGWTPGGGTYLHNPRAAAVNIARGEVGQSEGNGGCLKYGPCRTYDWCAMFVEWVWRQAGVGSVPTTWVATGIGSWGVSNGKFRRSNPVPGDIAVYGEPGSGTGGHVSLVVAVNPNGTITTVDGNYGERVVIRTIDPRTATAGSRNVRISGYVSPV